VHLLDTPSLMSAPVFSPQDEVIQQGNAVAESILIFEKDVTPYHVELIEKGFRQYFSSAERSVTLLSLGLGELKLLYNDAEFKKIVVVGWFQSERSIELLKDKGISYLNLQENSIRSNTGIDIRFEGEGDLAADYLIKDLNLEHIGFSGLGYSQSSHRRLVEFRNRCSLYGRSVEAILQGAENSQSFWSQEVNHKNVLKERRQELRDLLMEIPKPAGIFCANDALAYQLTYLARHLGFSVPGEICVLGIGGSHHYEEEGIHSVSIVLLDHVRQGYLAAEMMEQYLTQGIGGTVRINPVGILHRKTTTRRLMDDSLVRRASVLIQHDEQMTIDSLCKLLAVSRRTLETRFRAMTNMTIGKAIDFERFNRAKMLMDRFGYNKESIAALAGYKGRDHMWRSFHRFARMSPSEYTKSKSKMDQFNEGVI